jgi:hypothetical protein
LQVGSGGAAGTGSLLGTGAVSVTGAGTTLATAPVLAGGSGTSVIAGATTIGTATNPGILAPGLGSTDSSNEFITFTSSSGVVVNSGSQLRSSITTPTLTSGNTTVSAWMTSMLTLEDYIAANPGSSTVFNVAPAYGNHDYLNLTGTGAGMTLGTRASASLGDGLWVITSNSYSAPAAGDLFNLVDWMNAVSGSFTVPAGYTTGGVFGDVDLPLLSGGLQWDVSALKSHGIAAVVSAIPEPSRVMLLALALAGICLRRRRRL